jgi:hypothetical protein
MDKKLATWFDWLGPLGARTSGTTGHPRHGRTGISCKIVHFRVRCRQPLDATGCKLIRKIGTNDDAQKMWSGAGWTVIPAAMLDTGDFDSLLRDRLDPFDSLPRDFLDPNYIVSNTMALYELGSTGPYRSASTHGDPPTASPPAVVAVVAGRNRLSFFENNTDFFDRPLLG